MGSAPSSPSSLCTRLSPKLPGPGGWVALSFGILAADSWTREGRKALIYTEHPLLALIHACSVLGTLSHPTSNPGPLTFAFKLCHKSNHFPAPPPVPLVPTPSLLVPHLSRPLLSHLCSLGSNLYPAATGVLWELMAGPSPLLQTHCGFPSHAAGSPRPHTFHPEPLPLSPLLVHWPPGLAAVLRHAGTASLRTCAVSPSVWTVASLGSLLCAEVTASQRPPVTLLSPPLLCHRPRTGHGLPCGAFVCFFFPS